MNDEPIQAQKGLRVLRKCTLCMSIRVSHLPTAGVAHCHAMLPCKNPFKPTQEAAQIQYKAATMQSRCLGGTEHLVRLEGGRIIELFELACCRAILLSAWVELHCQMLTCTCPLATWQVFNKVAEAARQHTLIPVVSGPL